VVAVRALVTGGLGYVGAAVSTALTRSGHSVISIDDLSRASIQDPTVLGYTNLPISIQSKEAYAALEELKPDVIVHCAALAMVEEGERRQADYFVNNVLNHRQFVAYAVRSGVHKLIYSGTAAVYNPSSEQTAEDWTLRPISWYGWTKMMAEDVLKSYAAAGALDVVIFRYFSVVGSAWGILANRSYDEHAVTRLLRCAQTGEVFILNGVDHATRDGSPLRDFVGLRDLARAHVLAAEKLVGELDGLVTLNLGTGRGVSILELAAIVERVSGRKIRIQTGPRRVGDPSVMLCGNRRARALLGWHPEYSLESEIEDLWRLRRGGGVRDIPECAMHRR
jgi:UDP-glucose 4-epimerase